MQSDLKPCPFCGGEVERVLPPSSELSEYIRHKEHGVCPLEFTAVTTDGGDTMVAAWNTRAEAQRLPLTPKLIEHMVQRFLMWRLPDNFRPDAGISFKPTFNDHLPVPMKHNPTGTNLFDYTQAKAMVEHMLEGAPAEALAAKDAKIAELGKERDNLSELVRGWHYLAVGPDEMGDYYTQKQLIKLSEPYASPALKAIKEKNDVA